MIIWRICLRRSICEYYHQLLGWERKYPAVERVGEEDPDYMEYELRFMRA